jgi:NTP pyrophosphatase (non-canonical NTP hydrolase)
MKEQVREILLITQEECAEVTQAVSKCFRFGLDNFKPGKPLTNAEHLEGEIGDLLAMIDLLKFYNVISDQGLNKAKEAKIEKLKVWSNIYKDQEKNEQD